MQKNNKADLTLNSFDNKKIQIRSNTNLIRNPFKLNRTNFRDEKGESLLSKLSKSNSSLVIKKKKNRKKPQKWSENETNCFYTCLELYGRDFDKIVWVFKQKRKRQLVRKFHKERKKNNDRVQNALNKHKNNIIKNDNTQNSFCNNLFEKTDDSDDSESDQSAILDTKNITDRDIMESRYNINDNTIIPENWEQEEFEKEIENMCNQTSNNDTKPNEDITLKELLNQMHDDLKIPSQRIFQEETSDINTKNNDADNFKIEEENFFEKLDNEIKDPKYKNVKNLEYYLEDDIFPNV